MTDPMPQTPTAPPPELDPTPSPQPEIDDGQGPEELPSAPYDDDAAANESLESQ